MAVGDVVLQVHNDAPATHEFVVVRTNLPADRLPLGPDGLTVNEDWLDGVGELNEVPAGTVGTLHLTLAPGRYVFFCNLEGHTSAGCTPYWRSPRMVKGAAGRRLLAPGALHLDRRIGRTLAVYLVVITVIVGYNARAIADQRGSALSVNVAARQRALAERYEKDVILTTLGVQADPGADAQQLLANADALLHGGEVLAVQGADEEIQIRPASHDRLVVAKLEEENRLIQELIAVGDDLYPMRVGQPGYQEALRNLRIVGAQVTSISNDAVGQMTRETESALARLVAVVITLGVLGAFAALAMAWFLRKTAARRAAQFRSLVHNASDLITVLDVSGEDPGTRARPRCSWSG